MKETLLKKCGCGCGRFYSVKAFAPSKQTKDGLYHYTRDCKKRRDRQRRLLGKDEFRRRQQQLKEEKAKIKYDDYKQLKKEFNRFNSKEWKSFIKNYLK